MSKIHHIIPPVLVGLIMMAAVVPCLVRVCRPFVLEREDVLSLTIDDIRDAADRTTSIQVSGHVAHSSYAVGRWSTKERGNAILMRIVLVRVDADNSSGSFSYRVDVPEKVSKVRFGRRKDLIWRRNVLVEGAGGPASEAP